MRDEREGAVPPRVLSSSRPTFFWGGASSSFLLGAEPGHNEQLLDALTRSLSVRIPTPSSGRPRQNDARPPLHLPRPARPGDDGVGAQRQSRGRARSLSVLTCGDPVSKSETV